MFVGTCIDLVIVKRQFIARSALPANVFVALINDPRLDRTEPK